MSPLLASWLCWRPLPPHGQVQNHKSIFEVNVSQLFPLFKLFLYFVYFEQAIAVDQEIAGLDVTMENTCRMQIL